MLDLWRVTDTNLLHKWTDQGQVQDMVVVPLDKLTEVHVQFLKLQTQLSSVGEGVQQTDHVELVWVELGHGPEEGLL